MKNAIITHNTPRKVLLCLAAPLLFLHPGPFPANATTGDTKIRLVETYDLDLSSPQGRRERDRRIARAARMVCETRGMSSATTAACAREARQGARTISTLACLPPDETARQRTERTPLSFAPCAPRAPDN